MRQSLGIDRSKSVRKRLTSSFSTSIDCMVLFPVKKIITYSQLFSFLDEKNPESVKHSHFNGDLYIFPIIMKTTKEFLNFCNEFTVYVYYNIDRVIEMNYVRDYIIIVFSKCDHINESFQIGTLDVIDVISLMVVDNIENHFQEKKIEI